MDVWRDQGIQHGVHLEDFGSLSEDCHGNGAHWNREGAWNGKEYAKGRVGNASRRKEAQEETKRKEIKIAPNFMFLRN